MLVMHIIRQDEHLYQIFKKKNTYSELLNRMIKLNLSIKAIRSIEFAGGLDKYILSIPNNQLSKKSLKFKNEKKKKVSPNIKKKETSIKKK